MKGVLMHYFRGRLAKKSCARFVIACALLMAFQSSAWALINLRLTPADIVRSSAQVAVIELAAPKDKRIAVKVTEMLKGERLPENALIIDTADAPEATVQELKEILGSEAATNGLVLTSRFGAEPGSKRPAAMLCVGTKWFALYAEKDRYRLDKDQKDFDAIWVGGARTLTMAVKAMGKDPGLSFPVRAGTSWAGELKLGTVKGDVHGSLAVDLGGKNGRGVLLLAGEGDRFYQAAAKGGKPEDITANIKLTTTSKLAACGNFVGDNRIDIASWDGKKLRLARQTSEGSFVTQPLTVTLADCVSLATIDVGDARRAGLLAGTSTGPVLIIPTDKGGWKTQPLPVDPIVIKTLGAGGICATADFSHRGSPDVVQLFSKGYLAFVAEKPGQYKAPTKCLVNLPEPPTAVIFGDFDTDGELDMIVSGGTGSVLLSGAKVESLTNRTRESGELAYHGNLNEPSVVSISPWDINTDGRQGFALFYSGLAPKCFFNRGFSCFGLARELLIDNNNLLAPEANEIKLESAEHLKDGQLTGAIAYLSASGKPDLFAVDSKGTIWLLMSSADQGPPMLEVALPTDMAGPVTFTVSANKVISGMFVVRSGQSVRTGARSAGPLTLEWQDASGQKHKHEVPMKLEAQRIELGPDLKP